MSDSPRDELAELTRLLGAHFEWQRELGLAGVAVNTAELPRVVTAGPKVVRPAPAPEPEAPAAPPARFEMPSFLRKGDTPRSVPPPAPKPPPVETPVRAAATEPARAPDPPRVVAAHSERPKPESLRVIQDEVNGCTRCRLHEGRTNTVFARGNPEAPVAFVGEGPGRDEDLQGAPFVGAAGQLLDTIIAAMGLTQDEVYICNVVKCRPPNNRVPAPDEMAACGPYLVRQLGLVKPQLIVALGKTATGYLLGGVDAMSKVRGRWHEWQGIPLLATWHPAYLLRTPSAKRDTWDDMKMVLERLGRRPPKRGGTSA